MKQNLSKICADSLRSFTNKKYDIKLQASHAHELVAAYFGYASKNAMLADTQHPISNQNQSEIVVMKPDGFIDQRRENLQGLSSDLPDSYKLGEAVFEALFTDEWWASPYPPFRSFKTLAKYLVENDHVYQEQFKYYRDIPMHHHVDVKDEENDVALTVHHYYETSAGENLVVGKTTIKLTRVAGRIGYANPRISVEIWTAGAKRTLESLGVQLNV